MERVKTISHEGKEIIFLDFANCKTEEMLQVIAEGAKLIQAQPPKSVLALSDFTNSSTDPSLLSAFRAFTAGNEPYIKASAIVGLSRIAEIFYDIIIKFTRRNVTIFANADQAKAWLIAQ